MTLSEDILQARILIVDDQPANVRLLERVLQEAGYTAVSSTQDPAAVGGLHRQHDFDLILLDLQMPKMDGFVVMEGLKTNLDDPYLPVIVLTAQPGHKLRALQAGAKDFISKPFDMLEVQTRIRNMLEVRVLHRRLAALNASLEETVRQRTAELRESEARYRSLAELASDWYWEQDEAGAFTRTSGPVLEMLGVRVPSLESDEPTLDVDAGWDRDERGALRALIEERQPFIDFVFHRRDPKDTPGSVRQYRVSGQPMFDVSCRFLGYRGIGVEVMTHDRHR